MMNFKKSIASFLTLNGIIILVSCASSPPTSFITLNPKSGLTSDTKHSPVIIQSIEVPSILDRRPLVLFTDKEKIQISETAQWAAPLKNIIYEVVSLNLAARLTGTQVVLPGQPLPTDYTEIYIGIYDFSLHSNHHVVLKTTWGFMDLAHLQPKTFEVKVNSDSDDASHVAQAMSQALAKFSDHLALEISKMDL